MATARIPLGKFQGDHVSIKTFGGIADGASDNSSALASAATWAAAQSVPVSLDFPAGHYKFSTGPVFTKPIWLSGRGNSILEYTGSGKAIKFGPDGLVIGNITSHLHYGVRGIEFRGGASMTHGIYFNSFLTMPRIQRCTFRNFGNGSAYAIFCQSQNWDTEILGVKWYTDGAGAYNFVKMNGASTGGTLDSGQSRLHIFRCLGSHQCTGGGVGVWITGVDSHVHANKLEGFAPNVRVGARAIYARIDGNNFETQNGGNCIEFGDATGAEIGNFLSFLTIEGNYCNVHNLDFATTSYFIAPTTTSAGIQYSDVDKNRITESNRELVKLNNLASQVQNRANRNSINNLPLNGNLRTTGGVRSAWGGHDGDEWVYRQQGDRQGTTVVQAGSAAEQIKTLAFRSGVSGLDKALVQCLANGRLDITVNGVSRFQIDTNGDMYFPGGDFIDGTTGEVFLQSELHVNPLTDNKPVRTGTGHKLITGQINLESTDVAILGSANDIVIVKPGGFVGSNGSLAGNRPMKTGASGQPGTGAISLVNGAEVTTAPLTSGEIVFVNGTVLGSISYAALVSALNLQIADISGLQAALDAKSNHPHTHPVSNHTHSGVTSGPNSTDPGGVGNTGNDP